jgi:hypothetical protein
MKERGFKSALLDHLKVFGIWFALVVLMYFIIWPGMWVAPGRMLYEVYGNAFSYALQGSRLQVTQELQPATFSLDSAQSTIEAFTDSLIWRSTPISWLGFLLAWLFFFVRGNNRFFTVSRKLALYFFLTAVMFILLFSFAKGRNSAHYIMASFVSMDMIAGLGWVSLVAWLESKWRTSCPGFLRWSMMGTAVLLVGLQLSGALAFYPYYYVYSNPVWTAVTGKMPMSDYGEGFEQAAAYLAQKPNAKDLNVFAFRGRGPFSYFFPGQTIILNPLFMDEPGMGSVFERLEQADYLVINDAFELRTERTAFFVQELEPVEPEYSIYVRGAYPIHIYRVADLPPSFYEMLGK